MKHVQCELAAGLEVLIGALQGRELVVPRQIMKEGAERNDDKRIPIVQGERTHVGVMHGDPRLHRSGQCSNLLPELPEHALV